jgi:anti-sigma-K factor RskA
MNEHEKFADSLPLLALGALEGAERDELAVHARSCDQCSRELQRLNADLAMLALTTPLQEPPAGAKRRLMQAIAKEPKATTIKSSSRPPRWWVLIPSAIALGLIFVVGALWLQNRAMVQQLEALRRESSQAHADASQAHELISLLTARDAVRVTLVATNAKPQPTGRAIYSPRTGGLLFLAANMAPAPLGKTYELWLIPQQGAPIPAGTFKPDRTGNATIMMPAIEKSAQPKAFGVTIERSEGSTTPTLPLVLLGQR